MRKRIFIYIHYLEIGGAERALLSLLNSLSADLVDVDLFLGRHSGELMRFIPSWVNLLPEMSDYASLERPIMEILKEGHLSISLRRIIAKVRHTRYVQSLPEKKKLVDESIYQYVYRAVIPALSALDTFGEYDLAISFLQPHNIVLDKIKARRKVCWVHTDYSSININTTLELPVWAAFDYIACVSEAALNAFRNVFPTLSEKLLVIENILSSSTIRSQSLKADVSEEMPMTQGNISLLSIGRYSLAKRFELVPRMCRIMLDSGLRFKWYIIGYGDDSVVRLNIDKYGVEDTLVLLGKKTNPYPYIASSDIYVQPSLYEGKCVAVREAQILCRPVVICDYPTAKSQICDGVDGVIVPMDADECAKSICIFAKDQNLQNRIIHHLKTNEYGNEIEIEKIYRLIQ